MRVVGKHTEFDKTTEDATGEIPMEITEVPFEANSIMDGQRMMIQNWINAVLYGEELVAPGYEGIKSLSLSNAAYLSAWNDDWATVPVDEDAFLEKLQEKIRTSSYEKKEAVKIKESMNFNE